ncbi:TPA: phage major tail tube protein [Escherichia coli]|uniref:phage major tail tube protein n=5 Tax=Enterobacteriaceae TaxID=543 RepID=UPI000390E642|nr:phage major tail tube protein [Escherichia coli]EFB9388998.1 phage major tail tube protein [Escherichia coli]EFC1802817.1 phage major tail tube protein [Escherichia coli]EFG2713326.1 phage major tail tube protein [Escherichia coli]EFG7354095.1 phage major tail tube protein [Escherichia coli]EFM0443731.1 phage major tail tube protein [Escherichia coli]
MALPRKLKHLNLFNDGNNWQGIVESLTLPKFTRKYEKYRGGGMPGAVDVDLGLDDGALDTEFSIGGTELLLFKQMGKATVDGIQLRFTGSIQRDDTGEVQAVELVVRGRHKEVDSGEWKTGESNTTKVTSTNSYAKLTINGEVLYEVDLINMVEIVDGVRARSADFRETLNTRREKSWHKTTVGEVVKEIAARHKLKMALGKDLSDKPVEHIDQTNESDGSFLMRLARQYGAIASVKNGNLLFIRQGQGKSASGKPLPVITITRKDGDSHRFTLADRGSYTGVIASWLHTREPAKKESTTVKRKRRTAKQKKEPEAKQGDYLVGTDENVLVLNRTYANRGNAERAAKMQWERLQRGVASFSLQLAEGRADLYTEMPVKVSGFKQPIDDAEWTITTLTHTVSPDNGFTTSLELEVRIDDFEME